MSFKKTVVGLVVLVGIGVGAWVLAFGKVAPCDAMAVQLAEALKNDPASVRKAAAEATKNMSPILCVSGAVRLALGDRSFITIAKSGK